METIRAIYIGDVRFDQCPVFELNQETKRFEMLIDREIQYERQCVEEDDSGFLIFKVKDDRVTLLRD